MELGDFTKLAKEYKNRTGYSMPALNMMLAYVQKILANSHLVVADVGAGTGKLTENLFDLGLSGYAVEPNDAMREEGRQLKLNSSFQWSKGTGELTGLQDRSVDWVFMASSFHWTDQASALREFKRILRGKGFFTCLWNPRDLERSAFHMMIESKIHEIAPMISRVSSGSKQYTKDIETVLLSTGDFKNVIFVEAPHNVEMTVERYLGAWRSVNDIQAQAGPEKFNQILNMIEKETQGMSAVEVPYKTRAWTVQLI